jgi:uncharacterized protein (TIRG00374 family)
MKLTPVDHHDCKTTALHVGHLENTDPRAVENGSPKRRRLRWRWIWSGIGGTEVAAPRPSAPMLQKVFHFSAFAFVASFAVFGVYSFRADLSRLSFSTLSHSWRLLVVAMTLSLLNYVLRIARWRWYLDVLGHPLKVGFSALTYMAGFAFTLSPGRIGEVARAQYYLAMKIPVPDVGAAFLVERLMDLLAMLVLAAVIVTAFPNYQETVWAAAMVSAACLALLAILPWETIVSRFESSRRAPPALARLGTGVARSLSSARRLLRPQSLILAFLVSLIAWCMEGIGLGVLARTFPSPHLAMAVATGIYGVSILAGALSFLPGGLGSTEAVMASLLATRGYPLSEALVITFASRVVTLWFAVGLGWIALITLRARSWREHP